MKEAKYFPVRVDIRTITAAHYHILNTAAWVISHTIDWEKYTYRSHKKSAIHATAQELAYVILRASPIHFPLTSVDLRNPIELNYYQLLDDQHKRLLVNDLALIMEPRNISSLEATVTRDYLIVAIPRIISPLMFDHNISESSLDEQTNRMVAELKTNNPFIKTAIRNLKKHQFNHHSKPVFPLKPGSSLTSIN